MNDNSKRKKQIMFIVSSLFGGGAERVTVNISNALADRYNVAVVTLFKKEDHYQLDPRIRRFRYEDFTGSLPAAGRKALKAFGYLPRLLWLRSIKKQWRPCVTISMLSLPNLLNVLCGRSDFKILSERADPQWIGGKYYKSARYAFAKADHVVFQSRRVQNMFSEKVQRKSSIILNPVLVQQTASQEKRKAIVTAGRLADQKNHRLLIRAFGEFAKDYPDYTLTIYGKGPLKQDLEQLAGSLGLSGKVMIHDFAPDLHARIKDAEMFVLSSDFEGLSNSLLEAMMMGIPCISTDCAGSDEIIEDGLNGLLVPVGNQKALTAAMKQLAADAGLRERIGKGGVQTSGQFRRDTVIRQWIDLIEAGTGKK